MKRLIFIKSLLASSLILVALGRGVAQEVAIKSSRPERQIRLIALAKPFSNNNWMLSKQRGLTKDYTAQDVLEMIEELKPTCLERFITGFPNPNALVPVREGCEPMTVLEFLNKAIETGGESCHIVPKLNLQWLADEKSAEYFWEAAEKLYDLKLVRPIRNINLDVWDVYCKEIAPTPKDRSRLFKRLRRIGYEEIGVNMTGLYRVNDPQIDYADFNINKNGWTVEQSTLDKLKSYPNLNSSYLYIDYPAPMNAFYTNTPDRQAEIYYENIFPCQKQMGFVFVYPILQDE